MRALYSHVEALIVYTDSYFPLNTCFPVVVYFLTNFCHISVKMDGLVLLEPTDLYNMLQQATTFSNLSDQNYLLLIGKLILHCLALFVVSLTEIFGLWLIPAALELQYCGSRAATTCGSRAALKYFVCKLVFRL